MSGLHMDAPSLVPRPPQTTWLGDDARMLLHAVYILLSDECMKYLCRWRYSLVTLQ